jgi:hypothetical protein
MYNAPVGAGEPAEVRNEAKPPDALVKNDEQAVHQLLAQEH